MTKRINKILWHGTEVPQASSKADGLDGLNEGELFIKNDPEEPGIFIRTTDSKVVKVGDSGIKLLNRLFTAFDANGNQVAFDDFSTTIASIRANYGLWTEYFLSAKGRNPNTGSSSGGDGASTLGGLNNVADGADVGEEGYDVAKMLVLEANSNLWTLKNLSELVGLDEDALLAYLTENNYAKKSDIPSLDGYATESWVLGKGYATTSDLDARIDALVNGAPAAYDTLKEIADVLGKNVDSIADILDALGTKANKTDVDAAIALLQGEIDGLWARNSFDELYVGHLTADTIAAATLHGNLSFDYITNKPSTLLGYGITDAYTKSVVDEKLALKLDAVTFNELFEKVQLSDGTWAIRAKLGLYTDYFLSAKGANASGGSSTGGAGALYQLADVLADGQQVSGAAKGALLMYNGTQWQGVSQSEIVPNLTGYAKLTDIPTDDINKGVTAYGWGDHSKVGYLTGITSALVTGALGFTPFDSANFTKAKIKSTLGISDWALASSKPSYTTSEVTEGANLYFTNARAVAALKSITDGLGSDISTLQGYFTDGVANSALKLNTERTIWGQSFDGTGDVSGNLILGYNKIYLVDGSNSYYVGWNSNSQLEIKNYYDIIFNTSTERVRITNGGNVGIGTDNPQYKLDVNGTTRTTKLVIGNGSIEWDETNKGFKIVGGLYTESYLSAKGANTNGGSSSGGLITSLYRYADLGKTFADTSNDTFNAYTINKINTDLGNRISVLEGKATNVSFTQSLTSGTQIGTITIDGASKNIYAPTIPTKLSQFTNDLGLGALAYKGSLSFSELTSKPITISGYGITDAYTKNEVNTLIDSYTAALQGEIDGLWVRDSFDELYAGHLVADTIAAEMIYGNLGWDNLTNKPTTLGGYGISDAYISSGIVVLGSNSIKPLTAHQTIYTLTMQAGAFSAGAYTPNSAAKTIYIPTTTSHIGEGSNLYYTNARVLSAMDSYVAALQGEIDSLWARNEYSELYIGHLMGDTIAATSVMSDTMQASEGIWSDGYVSAKGQNTSSDIRLKNVLGVVDMGVGEIANAPSVRFSWKNGGGVDVGSIAQYWQNVLPDAVKERDGRLEMQYANIALLSAIALAKRVMELEKEISELKNR